MPFLPQNKASIRPRSGGYTPLKKLAGEYTAYTRVYPSKQPWLISAEKISKRRHPVPLERGKSRRR